MASGHAALPATVVSVTAMSASARNEPPAGWPKRWLENGPSEANPRALPHPPAGDTVSRRKTLEEAIARPMTRQWRRDRRIDVLYSVMMCGGIIIGHLSPMPLWLTLGGALTGYWSVTWLGNRLVRP